MNAWHVAWTRSGSEFTTVERLDEEGFSAFCPAIVKIVTLGGVRRFWRGKERQATQRLPAFPRYLFFSTTPAQPLWQLARKVDGVMSVLCPAGQPDQPWTVPSAVLEMLRGERGDGIIEDESHMLRSLERYGYNTRVLVTSGNFAQQVGPVVGDNGYKVRVLLSVLGRETPVELLRQNVKPVVA